ncbi:MAG: clan AA aspartic protease, partial [Flavobacteriaceae bacterium]|nr:clan AA aspartic protease [Flavobacteriaceae bacterium]
MSKLKLLFLGILFSQVCIGQNFSLNKGEIQTKDYYSEITFEYVNSKIIVPVEIEGKSYRFILDTGAPNIISKELFHAIKNDSLTTIPIMDINQKEEDLMVVSIPKLVLGDITFNNSASLVYDLKRNRIIDCFQIDGFIGSNMLRNSIVQIQLKNKLLKITNDKKRLLLHKKNSTKLKLLGMQSLPFIWMNLFGNGKAKDQILIDTGMSGFYDMSFLSFKIFEEENILKFVDSSKGSTASGLFGFHTKTVQYRTLIPKIKIANSSFTNFVSITTHDKYSKIGTDILNYGDITIDYKNKRFYFEPFQKEKIDLKEKLLGFKPAYIDDKIVIG